MSAHDRAYLRDWIIGSKPRRFDDANAFDLWMRDGSVRRARRVGNESLNITPGTLIFTDCQHPLQNVVCDERDVQGWRIREEREAK